ncbi:hypothetical protein RAB80_018344 [Fusarium oxysporum f. sp. vasinfectum]|uniref:Uncharacterized protein n=1 Tax=Fusarium oxysporum f. sp. vasinfectum 25433 TaxID=1089449 RepID=X0L4K7_FUSOX|nr:hypothetical protein FOTG_15762 [Fusarium oxysporum f. sp. vasinfectum 25433]KAK2666140.1 hypothetical protein RAB80_018240 [Fusarium oxysporum f. sp. vasinfectum]KAK2666244.1 hypothetical protein RAB80_018344 [Fusarium oxysporum f. sp. vasinfectum]KAK2922447.1 hypothetical protein FoTM2_017803 [Fusarium oxysporum f. sp. vasinfectum]
MRFPSLQEATQRTAEEPLRDLMPPVDASWVTYANKIRQSSTLDEAGVSSSLWDLVRNEHLDLSIVEGYLKLLRTLNSKTKIAPVYQLRRDDSINIETEGVDHSKIIPFIDGREWAFAVVYFDCIHWYDSGRGKPIPPLSASGGQRIVEGWSGPQHSDSKDSGAFMLMGISHIMMQQPHVSQEAAIELVQVFRVRMFIELLADELDPTPESLCEKGIITGAREDGASVFVSQADRVSPSSQFEEDPFNETLYVLNSAARDGLSEPPDPSALDSSDQIVCVSAARGTDPPQLGHQQRSLMNEANEAQSATGGFRNNLGNPYRHILPATRPLVATSSINPYPRPSGMNTSRRRAAAPRRRTATPTIDMESEPDIKSLINRRVILENLSSALRFTRSAKASGLDNGYMLWQLGKNRKTGGKLQQRYQRVLFNQKMAKRVDQNLKIDGLDDRQWNTMKKDFGYWKVWVDVRDVGLKYNDLGEYVALCALPGSMNSENMTQDYQKRLIAAFEREIENHSNPLHQWLRDARQLCDLILTKSIPEYRLKLDDYETNIEGEVSDEVWNSHMSTDPVGDFQD